MTWAEMRMDIADVNEELVRTAENAERVTGTLSSRLQDLSEGAGKELNSIYEYLQFLQQALPEQFGMLGINGGQLVTEGIRNNLLDLYQQLKRENNEFADALAEMVKNLADRWTGGLGDGSTKSKTRRRTFRKSGTGTSSAPDSTGMANGSWR